MIWTKEKPECSGYYWLRQCKKHSPDSTPQEIIVLVSDEDDDLYVWFVGDDTPYQLENLLEGEWAGPLYPNPDDSFSAVSVVSQRTPVDLAGDAG